MEWVTNFIMRNFHDKNGAKNLRRPHNVMKIEKCEFVSLVRKGRTTVKKSILIGIFVAFCIAQTFAAEQTPLELYQQALIQERGAGDLKQAIALYERVAKTSSGDRSLAAQALMGAARSYEKLGQIKESRRLYAEVARSYSEQSNLSAIAREHLTETGMVQGTVTHVGGGEPIEGAKVSLSGGPIDAKALEPVLALYAQRGVVVPVPQVPDETFLQNLFDTGAAHGVSVANPAMQATIAKFRSVNDSRFSAVSDGTGHFAIQNVLPGHYTIRSERDGYFPAEANAAIPADFTVTAGRTSGADVSMLRGASVSGRITDASGQPVANASVEAYSVIYRYGFPVMQPVVSKETNDQGDYRLFWLSPGEYLIAVYPPSSKPAVTATTAQPMTPDLPKPRTFYPGATDISMAIPVTIRGENPVTGIDFLRRSPATFSISGEVHSNVPLPVAAQRGAGPNLPNATPQVIGALSIRPRNTNVPDDYSTPVIPVVLQATGDNAYSGNFKISGLPSGEYNLTTYTPEFNPDGGAGTTFAYTPVDIFNQDVSGLSLTIYPTVRVNGSVTVDGRVPGQTIARVGLQVEGALAKAGVYQGLMARAVVAESQTGAFMIPAVPTGHFHIQLGQGLPPDLYVADIRQRNVSVFDSGFDVGNESPAPIEVRLSSGARSIEGTVRDAAGKPAVGVTAVLIPPANRRLNRMLYRTAISDINGHFKIQGAAPGDYALFAWQNMPDGAYYNDWFLSRYEDAGKKVNLGPGPLVGIDVKAIPAIGK
jgi:hypothetical protein